MAFSGSQPQARAGHAAAPGSRVWLYLSALATGTESGSPVVCWVFLLKQSQIYVVYIFSFNLGHFVSLSETIT